jgi:glycosyltransferase involved in cell wall biosynthesis
MVRAPISIIIPTYNDAVYLQDCLKSISKNKLLPQEIIIVDDGSKDDAANEIAKSQEFKFLNILFFKIQNIGPSGARNFGFTHSISEFILFLDADDFLPSNIIDIYTENLSQLPDSYFGICGRMKNFGKLRNTTSSYVAEENINPSGIGRPGQLQGQISCYVIRANYLHAVSGFDESLSHYEDFDLLLKLLTKAKLKTIQDIVLHKRFHRKSLSNIDPKKSYLGTKKFIEIASERSLFSAEEILLREKDNLMSYGKNLFFQLKISHAISNFNKGFQILPPISFKELCVYFVCKIYSYIK